MDMQDVKSLTIPEGAVKMIHDGNNRLLWVAVGYDTKYAGDTSQQTYSGKNKMNGSYSEISQTVRCTAEASGNGFKITSTASSGATYVTVPIPNISSLLGKTVTASYVASGDGIRMRYYYLNSNNQATSQLGGSTGTETLPSSLGSNAGIGLTFYTSNNSSATYTNIQVEVGSSPTSYEPYTGGIPAPSPSYPMPINVVTGTQTVTVSDGVDSEAFSVSLGSIELCKLGTYQDYIYKSGNDWYVHKVIEKISSYNGEAITTDYISTTGSLTNGATVYYRLVTATDTKITDATLIGQLDAIHQWLTRYGYNATVSGNLPLIVDRTNL